MSAKPIDTAIKEAIIRDWRTGEYSQRQLAEKHKVSNGAVAKLVKGVPQDAAAIVSAGVQYQQALQPLDERMVSTITDIVDTKAKRLEWLKSAAMKNVADAMEAKCADQHEYKARGDTILKAMETVEPKVTGPQVNIMNNPMALALNGSDVHG